MPILAEVATYAGQTWPCYGAHPRASGTGTLFSPWVHDGRTVHWGLPLLTRGEALEEARRIAAAMDPRS
jgi:hypothetical protein